METNGGNAEDLRLLPTRRFRFAAVGIEGYLKAASDHVTNHYSLSRALITRISSRCGDVFRRYGYDPDCVQVSIADEEEHRIGAETQIRWLGAQTLTLGGGPRGPEVIGEAKDRTLGIAVSGRGVSLSSVHTCTVISVRMS